MRLFPNYFGISCYCFLVAEADSDRTEDHSRLSRQHACMALVTYLLNYSLACILTFMLSRYTVTAISRRYGCHYYASLSRLRARLIPINVPKATTC